MVVGLGRKEPKVKNPPRRTLDWPIKWGCRFAQKEEGCQQVPVHPTTRLPKKLAFRRISRKRQCHKSVRFSCVCPFQKRSWYWWRLRYFEGLLWKKGDREFCWNSYFFLGAVWSYGDVKRQRPTKIQDGPTLKKHFRESKTKICAHVNRTAKNAFFWGITSRRIPPDFFCTFDAKPVPFPNAPPSPPSVQGGGVQMTGNFHE